MALNVLIVDDSAVMRKILERSLRQTKVPIGSVMEAGDGIEALEKLSSGDGIQLIFSDVNMPNMDGLEFLGKLKESAILSGVPVVMVTTEGKGDAGAVARGGGLHPQAFHPIADGRDSAQAVPVKALAK